MPVVTGLIALVARFDEALVPELLAVPVAFRFRFYFDVAGHTGPAGKTELFWLIAKSLPEQQRSNKDTEPFPETTLAAIFSVSYTHLTLPTILRV